MQARLYEEFPIDYCVNCIRPRKHRECGEFFNGILQTPEVPDSLASTHKVCEYCLDLIPKYRDHNCLFYSLGYKLRIGGWSTPVSSHILGTLRSKRTLYRWPLANLLNVLFSSVDGTDILVIPIPMSDDYYRSSWSQVVSDSIPAGTSFELLPTILRDKRRSTRRSVIQTRRQIVKDEYEVDTASAEQISGRKVVLVDDNVTTGTTMMHCVDLLASYAPTQIVPIAIERNISQRVLNRLGEPVQVECPHFQQR